MGGSILMLVNREADEERIWNKCQQICNKEKTARYVKYEQVWEDSILQGETK